MAANTLRTRIQFCGEDLVRNLNTFHSGLQDRPVVFAGHSLGGFVIQHNTNFVASLILLAGSHRGGLKALGYSNQCLRDKLQEFCRLWESKSIPTSYFFEDYDTNYGRRFWLPGTCHLNLNKFSGPLERSFLAVSR
ncbi:hypothetical protein HZ326_26407 [Fusarium oxysporum f. sp. albedinis]|nr:hypothetical protein HZ326_26407 [Fusarium oxysporum f. sp. albedinis]